MNDVTNEVTGTPVAGVQVSLQTVYLKDCSYESPNGPRVPNNQTWEPKFQLNMNTSGGELAPERARGAAHHHARGQTGRCHACIWSK